MHILLVEMRLGNIKGLCLLFKSNKKFQKTRYYETYFRLYTQNRTNDYEITIFCR